MRVIEKLVKPNHRYRYLRRHIVNVGSPSPIAVRSLVSTLREIATLLKLDGEKEGSGDINPFHFGALRLWRAVVDLANPKVVSRSIRFAIKKINVLLANEEACLIYRVDAVSAFIVVQSDRYRTGSTDYCPARIAEGNQEILAAF